MKNINALFEATVKSGKKEDYFKMAVLLKDSFANTEKFICAERFFHCV